MLEVALDLYGQGDRTILNMVKEKNPAIDDINLILVGQRDYLSTASYIGK